MSKPARFTWKTPDGATREIELTAAEISIGRAPTCDIVLPDDQMVSRRHAIVRRQGNSYAIVDLGSSNGTLINGIEIHDAATLKDGDRVTIGDQELSFFGAEISADAPAVTPFADSPSLPFYTPAPSQPLDAPAPVAASSAPLAMPGYDAFIEQDTGAIGAVASQGQSSYVHVVNGKEVEREEASYAAASTFESQQLSNGWAPVAPMATEPVAPVAPQRHDAASLLSTIQTLNQELSQQITEANSAADHVRAGIRTALTQLEAALAEAQSAAQRSAMSDLQQLAASVSQTPQIEQVANLARRSSEIRDVLFAHQQLLDALAQVRGQLMTTLTN